MREFVGVTSLIDIIVASENKPCFLKQQALMFNRIAIPSLNAYLTEIKKRQHYKQLPDYLAEVEWLLEEEIIFEPDYICAHQGLVSDDEYKIYSEELSRRIERINESTRGLRRNSKRYKQALVPNGIIGVQCETRLASIQLRELNKLDAYSVFHLPFEPLQKPQASKSEIIQITLGALPEPDELTSWEQIIEYRRDADSQGKFLALRNWMSDIAKASLTPAEIEEKLEWLVYDYQRHLKLHKLKTNNGALETILITGAEILENIVKFNWSKAAKAMFSFKHRQAALMEGELNSPGNEVAYILKTRERFSSK